MFCQIGYLFLHKIDTLVDPFFALCMCKFFQFFVMIFLLLIEDVTMKYMKIELISLQQTVYMQPVIENFY